MDVIRTVSSFDTGLTRAFWLVAGEQAIYARHASRVLAPHCLMDLPEQIPGAEASQFRLLGTRRFLPFFLTQFLGAFNDNLFRNAVVVSITFGAAVAGRVAGLLSTGSAAGGFYLVERVGPKQAADRYCCHRLFDRRYDAVEAERRYSIHELHLRRRLLAPRHLQFQKQYP